MFSGRAQAVLHSGRSKLTGKRPQPALARESASTPYVRLDVGEGCNESPASVVTSEVAQTSNSLSSASNGQLDTAAMQGATASSEPNSFIRPLPSGLFSTACPLLFAVLHRLSSGPQCLYTAFPVALHHFFATYGFLTILVHLATGELTVSAALIVGATAAAGTISYQLYRYQLYRSPEGEAGDAHVFVNPLWRVDTTNWRSVDGGMPDGGAERLSRASSWPSKFGRSPSKAKPTPATASPDGSPAMQHRLASKTRSDGSPTCDSSTSSPVAAVSPSSAAAPSAATASPLTAVVKSAVRVEEVMMLPVPHLASFYEQSNARNVLGDGVLHDYHDFTGVDDIVLADIVRTESMPRISRAYLRAGPRPTLCFNPKDVRAAVVTCGGLCPGLNNIVRDVTKTLLNLYGAEAVYGVRGGYWGFHESADRPPIELTHETVSGIHHQGGTLLGSSRGGFDIEQVLGFCERHRISQLYIVGGDGTHRAANHVGLTALERRMRLTVAGIPKTIDNDLDLIDRSFGFDSAVEAAQAAIRAAVTEARCNLPNGIGIVKLMGRHAGFIAAHATLAAGDVDLCLVPEVPIELDGIYGVLPHVERVLKVKGKAVLVVAEGAGEELVGASTSAADAGGNKALPEIGPYLKGKVEAHFKKKGVPVTIKYIDPSYMIRSVAANASDSMLCMLLAQNAVHGSMAGHTCFTTGLCNNRLVYLPIPAMVEHSPRGLKKWGRTWNRVVSVTGQPNRPEESSTTSTPSPQALRASQAPAADRERKLSIF